MLMTKNASASPACSTAAMPEPFMTENTADYERSFLDVLTEQIDLSKNQTYMAAESSDLLSSKFAYARFNQLKLETTACKNNITTELFNFSKENEIYTFGYENNISRNKKINEKYENSFENAEKINSAEYAEENKNSEKIDETEAETNDEDKKKEADTKAVEKYLRDIFGPESGIEIKLKSSNGRSENVILVDIKNLKTNGIKLNPKDILSKIEAALKKQFPNIKLSSLNIQVINAEFQPSQVNNVFNNKINSAVETNISGSSSGAARIINTEGKNGNKTETGGGGNHTGGRFEKEAQFLSTFLNEASKEISGTIKETAGPAARKFDQSKLLEQIRAHLNESKFSSSGGSCTLKMIIRPEELGRINLELVMKDGQLNARFKAESPAAMELLNASAEQLKEMLNEKGVKTVNIEFACYSEERRRNSGGEGNNGQNERNGGNNNDNKELRELEITGTDSSLETETVELSAINGSKIKSVFILNDKKINVRI